MSEELDEKERLLTKCDVLACHHCSAVFQPGEVVFEIFRSYMDTLSIQVKPEVAVSIASACNIMRVYRFHENCFKKIAGKEYMP